MPEAPRPDRPLPASRRLAAASLVTALRDSRTRTLGWTDDLTPAQWAVPRQPGVNPLAWELAHLAWFAEFWILRGPHRVDGQGAIQATRPPVHAGPDALLDSSRIAHADRWAAPLPRERVREMLASQLEACIASVPPGQDDAALYFHRLALFHEDMHAEAFAWLRATLGYPAPCGAVLDRLPKQGTVAVRGGLVQLGGPGRPPGFAFDNELPGRSTALADFEIDAAPISAGQFLEFVESDGYRNPQYWPGEAGRWRTKANRSHPERWRRITRDAVADVRWEARWFDRWQVLDPAQPVIHVNAFEAEAYCHWAGRALPTAAQWEHAASGGDGAGLDGCPAAFCWGRSVWEWTADAFEPYPGFAPGPYRDYSAPWFGSHRELRGGAFATHSRLHDAGYRNFFMAHRSDIFAGFRTVGPQGRAATGTIATCHPPT